MSRVTVGTLSWATVLVVCCTGAVAAIGTQFTYQGILADGGAPAEGTYDFRCLLYDADVGGSQVGSTLTLAAVAVSEGRVTLALDFGDVFDGRALWLELHVRLAGSPTYSVLSPRQRFSPAPYAMLSEEATSAAWAGDAGQLGGQAPGYYLAWSNLTGVPGGLDDGDDDTLAGLSCAAGDVPTWSGGGWTCDPDEGELASTYVAGPVGTASQNGAALLAAVAGLPAASAAQPLLLRLEPGIYDVGTATLVLPQWVDLEGSGRRVTKVVGQTGGDLGDQAVVRVLGSSEVRHLTLENNLSGIGYGVALEAWTGARVTDVEIVSTGNASYPWPVYVPGDSVVMTDVDVTVLDGTSTQSRTGIRGHDAADLELTRVSISVAGGSGTQPHYGLDSGWEPGGRLLLRDVLVSVTASAGETVLGVSVRGYATVDVDGLEVTATAPVEQVYGLSVSLASGGAIHARDTRCIASDGDSVTAFSITAAAVEGFSGTLDRVHAEARGAASSSRYGLRVTASSTSTTDTSVMISDSTLIGVNGLFATHSGTSSTLTVQVEGSSLYGDVWPVGYSSGNEVVTVGASMLSGSGSLGAAVSCAGVWDESHVFYANTCP